MSELPAASATVRPGDTLVLLLPEGVEEASVEAFRDHVARELPGVKTFFVVGAMGAVVYRPDEDRLAQVERRLDGLCETNGLWDGS